MDEELDHHKLHTSPGGLTTEQLLLLEVLCDRFEADFRLSKRLSIEEYLTPLAKRAACCERAAELKNLEECLHRASLTQTAESSMQVTPTLARALPVPVDSSGSIDSAQAPHLHSRSVRAGRFELFRVAWERRVRELFGKPLIDTLARWVAFKIPLTNIASDADRFLTEARTAARLHHPHILRVLDAGRDELGCFIVSELVEGMTLADKIIQERLDARAAAELLSVIAGAVAHAHQSGIVHRDLKPAEHLDRCTWAANG